MSKQTGIILAIVGGVLLLVVACCGIGSLLLVFPAISKVQEAAKRAERTNDLKALAIGYINYLDTNKRSPANLIELEPYLSGAKVVGRVRSGEIEVVYSAAPLQDQLAGASNSLLAWEKNAEPNGKRIVVFMDGSARVLDQSEFERAPRAIVKAK